MQVSHSGTNLKSAGLPGALILNNTDLTVDSRECEFECSPSHEWRGTRLLTIQITAAAEWLWQLTVWQQRTQGFSAGKQGEASPDTHMDTPTHTCSHTWVTLTNWYMQTHRAIRTLALAEPSAVIPACRASQHKLNRALGRRALMVPIGLRAWLAAA